MTRYPFLVSALSGSFGVKRLELRDDFRAFAIWTSDTFFIVFANGHRHNEIFVTLLAEIFVEGHRGA
jgi:hypothetical protein